MGTGLAAFEAEFASLRRRRRATAALAATVFALLVLCAVVDTDFYPSSLLAGLPRIGGQRTRHPPARAIWAEARLTTAPSPRRRTAPIRAAA